MKESNGQIFHLSPSQLGTFKEAPRYFWLWHHRGSRRPQGIFSAMPNAIDALMKARLDQHRAKGTLPPELAALSNRGIRLLADQDVLTRLRSTSKDAGAWTDPETGCTLFGALDDALVLQSGTLAPFDVKTTRLRENLLQYSLDYYATSQACYGILLGETQQGKDFGVHGAAFLSYYMPVALGVEATAPMSWRTEIVEMPIDMEGAKKTFRDAVACLRGPMPAPGPKEVRDGRALGWDSWAIEYATLVADEKRRVAAEVDAPAAQSAAS